MGILLISQGFFISRRVTPWKHGEFQIKYWFYLVHELLKSAKRADHCPFEDNQLFQRHKQNLEIGRISPYLEVFLFFIRSKKQGRGDDGQSWPMQKRQNEGFSYGKQQGKRKGIGSAYICFPEDWRRERKRMAYLRRINCFDGIEGGKGKEWPFWEE